MRQVVWIALFIAGLIVAAPTSEAAQITFSVAPNTTPGDGAIIIEGHIASAEDELNALEGVVGFFGAGSTFITQVVVETGGSVFTLWPTPPVFDSGSRTIRFSGGTVTSILDEGRIFRMRLFTESTEEIVVSWLGGTAYRSDGYGTPTHVGARSLTIKPEKGTSPALEQTSADRKPPRIESIAIAQDPDSFNGQPFLSVYATDDISGVAYYEVIERGVTTRVEHGPYLIKHSTKPELLVILYDRAGNSVSMEVPRHNSAVRAFLVIALLVFLSVSLLRFTSRRKRNVI